VRNYRVAAFKKIAGQPITKDNQDSAYTGFRPPAAVEMPVTLLPPKIAPDVRRRFHIRSLDHQRPLSSVTMAFSVGAYLTFVVARSLVAREAFPMVWCVLCALVLGMLVAAIPRAASSRAFGLIGVAYMVVLQIGSTLIMIGVHEPLVWMLPAVVVIPVCAGPLWLTPRHFIVGTIAYYLWAVPFFLAFPPSRDEWMICAVWIAIAISTAGVFHFGFYWFRLNHFLLEERLVELAETDPLTAVQNRRAFFRQAKQVLSGVRGAGEVVSAIFIDIDRFKSLNDQFGHAIGDDALRRVAQALRQHVPQNAAVGRLGGEEFAVLATGSDDTETEALAETMRASIASIARPDGYLTASFGVAHYRDGETMMTLLDRADEALLRAKQAGRNRVCVERTTPVERIRSTEIASNEDGVATLDSKPLRHDIRWKGVSLLSHYQPLWSLSHQKRVGVEALLRGEYADGVLGGALVSPGELFALCEPGDTGELDLISHELHLANARRQFPRNTWLFLNVEPTSFIRKGYEFELAKHVSAAGFDVSDVVIELLESDGVSAEELSLVATRYRDCGFLIAIDDFGAGYSNLDRLLRIQPDFVKLDGELIRARSRSSGQPLLANLVSLLHQADMLVIVEGIETTEELILAVESNVDFAQGFLLGRPGPVLVSDEIGKRRIDHAFDVVGEARAHRRIRFESQIAPYLAAMSAASQAVLNGATFEEGLAKVARSRLCKKCFVLGDAGKPITNEIIGTAWSAMPRHLGPLANPGEGRWDHRAYFWKAMTHVGQPVFTGPQLSLTCGRPCIIVAIALLLEEGPIVMAAELDWASPELAWPEML
jgi:diguanylate cyclase (GGDEF)-like protein